MKPIFVRMEVSKQKDAVEVRCGECKTPITWFITPINDDKVAYEKLKKYTRGYCPACGLTIDYEVQE